ncbi:MAG: winged helix-turn-helix domain-containing protein [Actinobacteria bacterium]|nr:winged helix-turn-helix domain-containing protein [Actinomycetota bacterium]
MKVPATDAEGDGVSDAPGYFNYSYGVASDGSLVAEGPGETFLRLTGYTHEDLSGLDAWQRFVHPDDLHEAQDIIGHLLRGEAWAGIFRVVTKTGSIRLMHFSHRLVRGEDGRVERIDGRGIDITEHESLRALLTQRDASLRLLASEVPIVLWSTDANLTFTSSTGSGLAGLGLQPNQVVGMTLEEFFVTTDEAFGPLEASHRALKGETVPFDVEWGGRYFKSVVEPFYDAQGTIVGTIGVAVDATDRLELETRIHDLEREVLVLRHGRAEALPGASPTDDVLRVGDLEIDRTELVVRRGDEILPLTPIEFRLLLELAGHAGHVMTRAALLEKVWGYDFFGGPGVVNMAIRRLREKVEVDPTTPTLIQTVRGVGYRLLG